MARFDNGWFKFYRRAFFEDIGRNQTCLALWSALLSMATYKETKIIWDGKQRVLPPGSVVFGMSEIAEKWEISKATVHKWLRYLASTERIYIEARTRGTLVTILNWEQYQVLDEDERTQSEHDANAARTPTERHANLSEEHKKEERKKEEDNTAVTGPTPEDFVDLWNKECGELPKVSKLSSKRKTAIKNRLKEEPDFRYWAMVISKLAASNFCNGQNDRGWKADIDFLLRPDTHLKVTEGKYDNREGGRSNQHTITKQDVVSARNRALLEAVDNGEI